MSTTSTSTGSKPATDTSTAPGCPTQAWEAFAKPFRTSAFAAGNDLFAAWTKTMNGVIDCNARLLSEASAVAVDAARANARTLERTGHMMLSAVSAPTVGEKPAATCAKPMAELAREILDDACTSASKTTERVVKLNGDYVQNLGKVFAECAVRSN